MLKPEKPRARRPDRITPRGAILVGMFCIVCGIVPVLGGLGVIDVRPAPDVAPWVVVAAGAMFMLAGLAIINGYALWGAPAPDGDLAVDAPFAARLTQFLLGTSIVGLMFAVFAWIAFGPGQRHFSASCRFPGCRRAHRARRAPGERCSAWARCSWDCSSSGQP